MPKEYLKCVESEMKAGKSKDDAQRICAIAFYKRHGITPQQAEKKGMFDEKNKFSEHKFTKNDDGTHNILDVPIFELGNHKGFSYDENWMQEALANFGQLKSKKWLPRIIIGHSNDRDEKPAVGFLDNLKLKGKKLYADFIQLREKTFNELKEKAWPGRSPEININPSKKKITALALLGGTEPHFPFEPIDIKFEDDPESQWIEFSDSDEKKNLIENIWAKMLEFFKESKNHEVTEMTPEEISKLVDGKVETMRKTMEKEFEQKFNEKYIAKFKEDFGVTPDEHKKNLDYADKKQFSEKKKTVLTAAKDKFHLAPAIVDGYLDPIMEAVSGNENETHKFAENQQGTMFDLIEKLAESLAKRFQDNTLFVDLGEHARFGGDDGNPNLGRSAESFADADEAELAKYDAEIEKYAEKHNISYEQAADKVLAGKK